MKNLLMKKLVKVLSQRIIITIVVIIILAAAVILSLGKNNPINSAKEAKVKTTIDNLKSELVMSVSKITADSLGQVTVTDIDAPSAKYTMADLIPSIKDTEYENELVVLDGKIQVKPNSSLPVETQIKINSTLGQSITSDIILNNPKAYIGATVEYTGYDEEKVNQDITWRIFNVTEEGIIQLIANDYVNLAYKGETPVTGIVVNGYSISSSDNRDTLISYLKTPSNWSEYAVSGKTTAVGAPTIEEFCSSYKLKYPEKYLIAKEVDAGNIYNGSSTAPAYGNVLKFSTEVDTAYAYNKSIGTSDNLYIKTGISYGSNDIYAAWLGSVSAYDSSYVMHLSYNGYVSSVSCDYDRNVVRPLVSLTSNVQIVDEGGVLMVK